MLGFLVTPAAKILAAFLAAVALFSFGFYKGHSGTQAKFDQYKAEVSAAAKVEQDRLDELAKRQSNISKKAEVRHEKSMASIRSTYAALRMRSTTGGGSVPAVPDTASQPAEATAHYVSVAPELAEQCAQTTQQLIDLQDWVADQLELTGGEE